MSCYLNIFRAIALILPQLTLGYFIAGSRDLLWGFNQTSAGFTTLLAALALSPLLCLACFIIEVRYAYRRLRGMKQIAQILRPLLALLILVESLYIDAYILSYFRM